MGKTSHGAPAGIPWYESNLIWGPVGLGGGLLGAVIADRKNDLGLLLWLAGFCLLFAAWGVVKRFKLRWVVLAVLTVSIVGGLYAMNFWLAPAGENQTSKLSQASSSATQSASEKPTLSSGDAQSRSTSSKIPNSEHKAEPHKVTPKRPDAPAAVIAHSQDCPNGICIAGDNNGTATVNNFPSLQPDKRIIQSMVLRVSIETGTAPAAISEPATDTGLQSCLALFTAKKTRLRFCSDWNIVDEQFKAGRRRLALVYSPETPREILGKEMTYLASITTMAVDFQEIFKTMNFDTSGGHTRLSTEIVVNGVTVAEVNADEQPVGTLNRGPAVVGVSESFSRIPDVYASVVSSH